MPELLDAYLADALDGPRRNALRGHLRNCEHCREAAIQADPSLLFVAAPPGEPDPARVDDVTRAVVDQIRQQEGLDRRHEQ
jgi:anti-sigma factor RsiW